MIRQRLVTRVPPDVRRAVGRFAWLTREVFPRRLREILVVTALGAVGASARGATIGVIVKGASLLDARDAGSALEVLGYELNEREAFVLGLVVLLALELTATIATYMGAAWCRRVGRAAADRAMNQIDARMASVPSVAPGEGGDLTSLRLAFIASPRVIGILVESMVNAIRPIIMLAVVVGILFSMDLRATLLVLTLTLLTAPAYLWLTRRIQINARGFFDESTLAMSRSVAGRVDKIIASSTTETDAPEPVLSDRPDIRECSRAFDQVVLASHQAILLTGIARGVILVSVLGIVAIPALTGNAAWSTVIGFLLAVGILFNRCQELASILATLSKLHPHLRRYLDWLEWSAPDARRAPGRIESLVISTPDGPTELEPGESIAYATDVPLNLVDADRCLRPLWDATGLAGSIPEVAFISAQFKGDERLSISALLHAAGADPARIEGDWGTAVAEVVRRLDAHDEEPLTVERWAKLPRDAQVVLGIMALGQMPGDIAAIDQTVLAGASRDVVDAVLEHGRERITIVVGRPVTFGWPMVRRFAAVENGVISGVGDFEWFKDWRDRHRELSESPVHDASVLDELLL